MESLYALIFLGKEYGTAILFVHSLNLIRMLRFFTSIEYPMLGTILYAGLQINADECLENKAKPKYILVNG